MVVNTCSAFDEALFTFQIPVAMLVTPALWHHVTVVVGTPVSQWQTVAVSHMSEATALAQVGCFLHY